ncbi:MAG: hypothetical protein AAB434_03850 [Planctomycetota bacterium]
MVTTERETPRVLPPLVDEGFPGRTTRTSILFSVIVCVFMFLWEIRRQASSLLERHAISIGFAAGAAIIIAAFAVLIWGVRSVIRTPEEGKPRRPGLLVAVIVLQLPVIGAAMYGSLVYLKVNVFAMVAGLSVWFFVAILKVASILLIGPRQTK